MISVLALLSILVSGVSSFWFTDSHVNSISVNLFHLNSSMYQENIHTIEEETYEIEIEIEVDAEVDADVDVEVDADVEVENLEAVDTDENIETNADEADADEVDADETDADETDADKTDDDEAEDTDENVEDEGKSEDSTLSVEEY